MTSSPHGRVTMEMGTAKFSKVGKAFAVPKSAVRAVGMGVKISTEQGIVVSSSASCGSLFLLIVVCGHFLEGGGFANADAARFQGTLSRSADPSVFIRKPNVDAPILLTEYKAPLEALPALHQFPSFQRRHPQAMLAFQTAVRSRSEDRKPPKLAMMQAMVHSDFGNAHDSTVADRDSTTGQRNKVPAVGEEFEGSLSTNADEATSLKNSRGNQPYSATSKLAGVSAAVSSPSFSQVGDRGIFESIAPHSGSLMTAALTASHPHRHCMGGTVEQGWINVAKDEDDYGYVDDCGIRARESFVCFPGGGTVVTPNGVKTMRTLREGDLVQTFSNAGEFVFEPVLFFLHRNESVIPPLWYGIHHGLEMQSSLVLSGRHMVFKMTSNNYLGIGTTCNTSVVQNAMTSHPFDATPALDLRKGDTLFLGLSNGSACFTSIQSIAKIPPRMENRMCMVLNTANSSEVREERCISPLTGVYAPVTSSGTLLVDGVFVSSYSVPADWPPEIGVFPHWLADLLISPIKYLHKSSYSKWLVPLMREWANCGFYFVNVTDVDSSIHPALEVVRHLYQSAISLFYPRNTLLHKDFTSYAQLAELAASSLHRVGST